jgi:hypothetical protein
MVQGKTTSKSMQMTITEKILARAAGRDGVKPGDKVWMKCLIFSC